MSDGTLGLPEFHTLTKVNKPCLLKGLANAIRLHWPDRHTNLDSSSSQYIGPATALTLSHVPFVTVQGHHVDATAIRSDVPAF